jgi:hypothetical protein
VPGRHPVPGQRRWLHRRHRLGLAPTPAISGRTKTEVRDKLIKANRELEAGVRTPANYTVAGVVEDRLSKGLKI